MPSDRLARLNRRDLIRVGAGATAAAIFGAPAIRPGTASAGISRTPMRATSAGPAPMIHSPEFTEWVKTLPQPNPDTHARLPPAPRRYARRLRRSTIHRLPEGHRS
jgi:hypothetical protein